MRGATITSTFRYNNRLQPSSLTATVGSTTVLNLSYNFTDASAHNNGNVMGITNGRVPDGSRNQTFAYDKLNRIQQAKTQATSGLYCWGQDFTIDIWGNLTNIAKSSTHSSCTVQLLNSSDTNADNRLDGFGYDAAGNMTNDGPYNYAYDAENRQTSAASVTYTYDGDGKRVKKSNGKLYWYGLGGEVLTETDLSGNYPTEYVFFGGRRIARRDPSGTVYYYFGDHLGTLRVIVQAGQTAACYEADYYPYGGERVITNTCPQNYKFTARWRRPFIPGLRSRTRRSRQGSRAIFLLTFLAECVRLCN